MKIVALEAIAATSLIASGIIIYIRMLKKKMKRFVLRHEEIEKYFREK